MKNILHSLAFLLFISATTAQAASTFCGPAKVAELQPSSLGDIRIKLTDSSNPWHLIGVEGDIGVSTMYSTALAALASGKNVLLKFPGSYDCSISELTTPISVIRIYGQ